MGPAKKILPTIAKNAKTRRKITGGNTTYTTRITTLWII